MDLDGIIRQEYTRAADALDAMNDLRRAWASFQPAEPLNRSDMITMGAIAGMTGRGHTVTVSHLARRLHQSLPGISQKVSALEEQGYLRRVPDACDRRVSSIQLTEAGRQMADRGLRQFLARLEQALDLLGPDHTDTLVDLMRRLCDAMRQVQSENGKGAEENC